MTTDSVPPAPTFPDRTQLIADLAALLKMARRPVSLNDSGPRGPAGSNKFELDTEGLRLFDQLVQKLIRHLHFEHHDQSELNKDLIAVLADYQTALPGRHRRPIKKIATTFIDERARPPESAQVFFGIVCLAIPNAVDLGVARFFPASEVPFLEPVFGSDNFAQCSTYCATTATGGTTRKLVERAEHSALLAASLLRLHLRSSLGDLHREQLLFDLHSCYAIVREDGAARRGFHRGHQPAFLEVSQLPPDWTAVVEAEGHSIRSLPAPLRVRVNTALEWMDIEARAPTWKTQIPAIFSAIESLLVPEDCGSKAEVVTVRSVILQLTLGESFFNPANTYEAYLVRCDLVHGSPIDPDVTGETERLAGQCQSWAREILTGYITYASQSTATTPKALVQSLDRSEAAARAQRWFQEHGGEGAEIVVKYRKALGLKDCRVMAIVNVTQNVTLARQADVADSFWSRSKGLIGRRRAPDDYGLIIRPCNAIHTFFLSFPIDVLYLDRQSRVLRILPGLQPWRIGPIVWRGKTVVELPAGTAARTGTVIGDIIAYRDEEP